MELLRAALTAVGRDSFGAEPLREGVVVPQIGDHRRRHLAQERIVELASLGAGKLDRPDPVARQPLAPLAIARIVALETGLIS